MAKIRCTPPESQDMREIRLSAARSAAKKFKVRAEGSTRETRKTRTRARVGVKKRMRVEWDRKAADG